MSNFQDYSFIDLHPVLCHNQEIMVLKDIISYLRFAIQWEKRFHRCLATYIDIDNHLAYLSVPHRWIFIGDNYLFQGSSFAGVVFCPNLKMNTTFSLS